MKKLRICLEINGLAEDENGRPCPGGLDITLGENCEEEFSGEEYRRIIEQVNIAGVLKLACLDGAFSAEDCRLMTPEEYDREYGKEE